MYDNASPADAGMDVPVVAGAGTDARVRELEEQLHARDAQVALLRGEALKARLVTESGHRLPVAYQAIIPATEDETALRVAIQSAIEQHKADLAEALAARGQLVPSSPGYRVGSPSGQSPVPLPRWHGKRPSEIPSEDWPAYKREVLGLR